jgi:hypothetical protein
MGEIRNAYKILVGKYEGKRPLCRSYTVILDTVHHLGYLSKITVELIATHHHQNPLDLPLGRSRHRWKRKILKLI